MAEARVVMLGATGFTGRLTAQELVDRGQRPLLVGRDGAALGRLAEILGVESVRGDAAHVGGHLHPGDVLVTCAGPFARVGETALAAAIRARAHVIDCSGEAGYLRAAVRWHDEAVREGVTVVPGFGFEYVPGHVAAVAALGAHASERIRILYLLAGAHGASRGTRASQVAGSGHVLRDRELVGLRDARWVQHELDGRPCRAAVIGSTEALLLPRVAPAVRDIEVALGRMRVPLPARPVHVPAVEAGIPDAALGGPPARQRARSGTVVAAWAGEARARVDGPDGYELTARLLATGALRLLSSPAAVGGVRGPIELFGHEGARAMLEMAGMTLAIADRCAA